MPQALTIFEFDPSIEDDRPEIEFDAKVNQGVDWQRLDAILRGERPVTDYDEVQVRLPNPDASSWGFFSVPGTLGLISGAAVELLGHSVFRLYDLLPAKLNEARFFFLKTRESLPCLDKEKSEVVTFRSDPSRVKEIRKHVFLKAVISDPLVFSIPESLSRLYATTTVYDIISQSGIPGFRFTPLE